MEYLTPLEEHGAALLDAARANYDAPVPTAPDWDVATLTKHIGRVWGLVEIVARTRASERPSPPAPPDDRGAWASWAEANLAGLLAALRDLGADEEVWNWSVQPNTGAFWPRRMCQETLVHRWDVENAAGEANSLPAELAADGIDEFFDAFLPLLQARQSIEGLSGSLHLHATDGAGEWLVHLKPDSFTASHEHAKGDAAIRGTASDLLLFVWNRLPASSLEVFGNTALVDTWASRVRI